MSLGRRWRIGKRVLEIGSRPLIMGIVNVTPDSFSDGGKFYDEDKAVEHGRRLAAEGADLLDIGGESTRPGAEPVAADEERRRVIGVIARLKDLTISVDTSKASVAAAALNAGAVIINDVTALGADPEMLPLAAERSCGLILMHMQGTPQTMQNNPRYDDVVDDISRFFEERLRVCERAGIDLERIALDPGIGFGKTTEHNLELLARLGEFRRFGRPICLGVSRKGFIGRLLNPRPVEQRLAGSLAAVCHAALHQTADIVRVHDVRETLDALLVLEAIVSAGRKATSRRDQS
ncbi:MAG: dihydropteroate synthase [Gemmatales bacterium]|nr:MAG: dihydropteroate synthase [Gemmatales bacterium]